MKCVKAESVADGSPATNVGPPRAGELLLMEEVQPEPLNGAGCSFVGD